MLFLVAIIASVMPIAGFTLSVLYYKQYRRVKSSALLIGLSCSGALYGYRADSMNDIYRHISNLERYSGVPLIRCFDLLPIKSVYTWDIWSWIISRLNNPNLLQSSGALVGYSLLSYIILDYAKVRNAKYKNWFFALSVSFCITSPLNIAVGIRNVNAFLIAALALYIYYVKKSPMVISIFLLVMALFLHHAVIIVILGWMITPLFIKHKYIWTIILGFVLFSFNNYGYYLSVLSQKNFLLSDLAADTMYSAASYQSVTSNNSLHSWVTRIIMIILSIALLYRTANLTVTNETYNHNSRSISELWNLSFVVFVVGVFLMLIIGSNGSRFFIFSDFICVVFLIDSGIEPCKPLKYRICNFVIFICAISNVALFLYDMNWGTGSLSSFIRSSLFGYLSRWLFER